jgi:hypothetical protein
MDSQISKENQNKLNIFFKNLGNFQLFDCDFILSTKVVG